MRHPFLLTVILLLLSVEARDDEQSCEQKGFDPELVLCKVCEKFKPLPDGDDIYKDCMRCCSEDKDKALYSSGTLVYCSCRFRYDPELAKLVASIPGKFPNIETKDVHGSKLQLEMKKISGGTETVAVDSWSHENIIDFLTRKLEHAK